MALFSIISSYISGKILSKYKIARYKCILVGILLLMLCNISLGLLEWTDQKFTFQMISFGSQILGGIGAGMISTGCLAILTSYDGGSERERNLGLCEAANGLGLLVGPLAGGILYLIGGFCLPFMFFAGAFLLCYPLTAYVLYAAH